jgi:hypothetical protein
VKTKTLASVKKSGRPAIKEKNCTGKDLAKAIAGVEIPPEDARNWHKELMKARKSLLEPKNRWE